MPGPYDLIQQAKQRKKREDGNKRADKWASIQASTVQSIRPVDAQQPAPQAAPSQAPTQAQQSRHANLDAIHKRHNEAMKNVTWKKAEPPESK